MPLKVVSTKGRLTSRAGLFTVVRILKALRVSQFANKLFPDPGSNRGYKAGDIIVTLVIMLHEGATCLEDVAELQKEKGLLRRLGIKAFPSADTLARFLKRHGIAGLLFLQKINCRVMDATLYSLKCKGITMDIDATVLPANKSGTKRTYYGCPGDMLMVGTIAETGQVLDVELRAGNVSPAYGNLEFIKHCQEQLPAGVGLKRVRVDAAGYQKALVEYCDDYGIGFAIRAKWSKRLRSLLASIEEYQWQPLQKRDGTLSEEEGVVHTRHAMHDSNTPFKLVIQRCLRSAEPQVPVQQELPGMSIVEEVAIGKYIYRAIATNIEELSDSQVVHFYNQRGECSENRIKELKSDFAAKHLPCSDDGANALYVSLCALAYNVFALLRTMLPAKFRFARAPTVRSRIYAQAGKIVRHGRQWLLKVRGSYYRLYEEILRCMEEPIQLIHARICHSYRHS